MLYNMLIYTESTGPGHSQINTVIADDPCNNPARYTLRT